MRGRKWRRGGIWLFFGLLRHCGVDAPTYRERLVQVLWGRWPHLRFGGRARRGEDEIKCGFAYGGWALSDFFVIDTLKRERRA